MSFSTEDRPSVKVPSPFEFDVFEFLPRKRVGCKTSNAFMIYRKIYVKTLLKQQLHYKMTDASNWASRAWKEEPEYVKHQFQEYAKNLKKIYNQRAEAFIAQRQQPPPTPLTPPTPLLPQQTSSSSYSSEVAITSFDVSSIISEKNLQNSCFFDTDLNFENNGSVLEFLNVPNNLNESININSINSINQENPIRNQQEINLLNILNSPFIDDDNNSNNNNNDSDCRFCKMNIVECICPEELFQLNFLQSPLPLSPSLTFENSPLIFDDNNYYDKNYDYNYGNYDNYDYINSFNEEFYMSNQ